MQLEFEVQGQQLIRKDDRVVASYVRNHLKCLFVFDKEWINLKKYAIFEDALGEKEVVLLGFGKDLSCFIPSNSAKGNYLRISVFANELYTSTQETILIRPSGYDDLIDEINMEDSLDTLVFADEEEHRHKRCDDDDDEIYIPPCKEFFIDEHPFE